MKEFYRFLIDYGINTNIQHHITEVKLVPCEFNTEEIYTRDDLENTLKVLGLSFYNSCYSPLLETENFKKFIKDFTIYNALTINNNGSIGFVAINSNFSIVLYFGINGRGSLETMFTARIDQALIQSFSKFNNTTSKEQFALRTYESQNDVCETLIDLGYKKISRGDSYKRLTEKFKEYGMEHSIVYYRRELERSFI